MNWTVWLQGLAAAAINGAATGGAQAAATGRVNTGTAVAAGIGAALGALLYLTQSPIKIQLPPAPVPPAAAQKKP